MSELRIKTGAPHFRKCVYWDNSKKYTRNGKVYRHAIFRADVTIIDTSGLRRIRRRFKSKEEAYRWLEGY